jgi:hypothetical protein
LIGDGILEEKDVSPPCTIHQDQIHGMLDLKFSRDHFLGGRLTIALVSIFVERIFCRKQGHRHITLSSTDSADLIVSVIVKECNKPTILQGLGSPSFFKQPMKLTHHCIDTGASTVITKHTSIKSIRNCLLNREKTCHISGWILEIGVEKIGPVD